MRVRNIEYFLNTLGKINKNGPKNVDEILNQELAEYYYFAPKKLKKVA